MLHGAGSHSPAVISQSLRLRKAQERHPQESPDQISGSCCTDTQRKTQQTLSAIHRRNTDKLIATQQAQLAKAAAVHLNDIQNLTISHRDEMRRIMDTVRRGTVAAFDFATSQLIPTNLPNQPQTTVPRSPNGPTEQIRNPVHVQSDGFISAQRPFNSTAVTQPMVAQNPQKAQREQVPTPTNNGSHLRRASVPSQTTQPQFPMIAPRGPQSNQPAEHVQIPDHLQRYCVGNELRNIHPSPGNHRSMRPS